MLRLLYCEVDHDLARLTRHVLDLDLVAVTRAQLREQRQRIVVVAEAHGFARRQGFNAHAEWLEGKLAEPYAGPTVVITHHAPSQKSIHPRFADSLLNACFVSDAERLIDGRFARVWIHGHTHDSFDYVLNGTRVVCNPRGYVKDAVNENRLFDANFSVEIE